MSEKPDHTNKSVADAFQHLSKRLNERIIGQPEFCDRLIVALLADGHLLVEGVPGLAKTQAVRVLASTVDADFHRVQFTPDLLPSDLIGTEVYHQQKGTFHFVQGPLFHNFVLADEINRAPAKVQSALLEAMAERQITVAQKTYPLPDIFMVLATQNPIEHAGTHELPEAQLDRFLMHVQVGYPQADVEQEILEFGLNQARGQVVEAEQLAPLISQSTLSQARQQVLDCYISPEMKAYMVALVQATRKAHELNDELAGLIRFGASPRATIALARCACAYAWMDNRDYVSPQDVQAVIGDVLRHRIVLSHSAQLNGVSADDCIDELVKFVPVP